MNYKEFFNNKRIAVIGIGPYGEMLTDIRFLFRNKANITLYDMRSEKRLKSYMPELREIGLSQFNFGSVDGDGLVDFDLIIISPEISKKSLFLRKASKAGVQIEYPDTLFFKLSPPITLIGVIGMYGKSVVTSLIHTILKKSLSENKEQSFFLIDPDSTNGALNHLKKIKKDDVVLVRIPEELLLHYEDIHISPHVAVITSPIPFSILNSQTYNNFIIANDTVVDAIKFEKKFTSKAKILRTRPSMIPPDWIINSNAIHDKENIALVLQICELFKVNQDLVKDSIQSFSGIKGSMELTKKIGGVEYYNDSNSRNPLSTLSALRSLAQDRNVVLILGGAYTGHDHLEMLRNIPQYASTVILLPGSGTLDIHKYLDEMHDVNIVRVYSLEEAVKEANKIAKKGDRVLFSPGFEAVGIDLSRKERGEKFVKFVKNLSVNLHK